MAEDKWILFGVVMVMWAVMLYGASQGPKVAKRKMSHFSRSNRANGRILEVEA